MAPQLAPKTHVLIQMFVRYCRSERFNFGCELGRALDTGILRS